MNRLAARGEPLKRQLRRPARIEGQRPKIPCHRLDVTARPAVERVRLSIVRLGRLRKYVPLHTAGEAEQCQRAFGHGRWQLDVEFARSRMKRATDRETECRGPPAQLVESARVAQRPARLHDAVEARGLAHRLTTPIDGAVRESRWPS